MKPTAWNAFERSWSASRGPRSLVSMLTPMQAKTEQVADNCRLTLTPIRAVDALGVWSRLSPSDDAHTLLSIEASCRTGNSKPLDGLALLERLEVDTGEVIDASHYVLSDVQLRTVLELIECDRVSMVRLSGIVDARDAAAIDAAYDAGDSVLDAELRAVAGMTVTRDQVITLEVRTPEHAHMLVAENFRQYLAALLSRPASLIEAPRPWQIERLMSETNELTVRPIESEVYTSFVDIGISTLPAGAAGPAARSLIYDLPSGTWHDED